MNKFQKYLDSLIGAFTPKMGTAPRPMTAPVTPRMPQVRSATKSILKRPGIKRKGIKRIPPVPRNKYKADRKPASRVGHADRLIQPKCSIPSYTLDQVRLYEAAFMTKLIVKMGQLFHKSDGRKFDVGAAEAAVYVKRALMLKNTENISIGE